MEDFSCNIEVKPISEWIKGKKGCPPCLLAPLAGYYLGTLKEAGETQLAKELEKIYQEGDHLTICKKLDNIKNDVGEALSKQLRDLDCFAQTFKPDKTSK